MNYPKLLLTTSLLVFSILSLSAQKDCIASSGLWSDLEEEHPFFCNDITTATILLIPADVTVSIDATIDFSHEIAIIVEGVLFFDGNTSRLSLPENSAINVLAGGGIQTNVSNNSQKIKIGSQTHWTSKNGNVTGPFNFGHEILPVELVDFQVKATTDKVRLQWTTLSEENSDRFFIEHSLDAIDFVSIGEVSAAGFSKQEVAYQFEDLTPASGVNYYRLRQVDFDGSEMLSEIRVINFLPLDFFQVQMSSDFSKLRLHLKNRLRNEAQLRTYDLTGRLMTSMQLEIAEQDVELDISEYEVGQYVLQVVSGGQRYAKTFVKVKV